MHGVLGSTPAAGTNGPVNDMSLTVDLPGKVLQLLK